MQTSPSVLSKNQRSQVRALWRKKGRETAEQFLVESPKAISEFLEEGWPLITLYRSPQGPMADHPKAVEIPPRELAELSTQESPQGVLAVFGHKTLTPTQGGWVLVLDRVQDPGNVGTLLRLADWFGIDYVALPPGTAEVFNPKVIQGSMGSIARVPLVYGTTEELLARFHAEGRSVYVADLGGEAPAALPRKAPAALVLGNEGQGPEAPWTEAAQHILTIPRGPQSKTESLNVGTAGAIALYACMSQG
ncbi:MAG: RNA methyltransferase [Flavobacteriia bacterium]|nr:RNA methyltransferase [Flavobacteriia bacterium]NDD79688.1 RNA methyltransferase [Flavobacteriia bacterium]